MSLTLSEFGENLGAVLVEARRACPEFELGPGHRDGCANAGDAAGCDAQGARANLRIGKDVGERVDGTGGDALRLQRLQQWVALPAAGLCF